MAFSPVGRLICHRLLSRSRSRRMSTTRTVITDKIRTSYSSSSSSSSPWLMLPPSFGSSSSSSLSYNFYSLAKNRVLTPRPHIINGGGFSMPKAIHNLRFCGSTHGWLALSNPDTFDLVLYDPISGRHINLPPLPNFDDDDDNNHRGVTKIILSSSDDVDSCLAVMIYNRYDNLALCFPGRSKEWTPIGNHETGYDDIVYSRRQNLFFALNGQDEELEAWSLNVDPYWNRMIKTVKMPPYKDYCNNYLETPPKDRMSDRNMKYLVMDDHHGLLFFLSRHVMNDVAPDGSYIEYYNYPSSTLVCPHMTLDFHIHVYDHMEQIFKPLQESARKRRSLGDLALFIGCQSDSVALSTTRFPELKPNSIYFTDPYDIRFYPPTTHDHDDDGDQLLFGGHDIGIFDCEKRTVSPCYYPCDVRSLKRVVPLPMWFFPRGLSSSSS